jgi:preprotein translocase subunit Sss1
MQCPNCKSEALIKLSLVHSAGLSEIETHSRGRGLILGNNGVALGFGNFKTTGTSQTRLSKLANPPRKKPYLMVIFGWLLGLLILGWLLGYATTISHAPEARFEQQFRWILYGFSSLAAIALVVTWRYNHRVFPRRLRFWNRSFICRHCGEIFQTPTTGQES